MITKLFKNDFMFRDGDYEEIERFFEGHIDSIDRLNYVHNFDNYKMTIDIYGEYNDEIKLNLLTFDIYLFDLKGNLVAHTEHYCGRTFEVFLHYDLKANVTNNGNKETILFSFSFKQEGEENLKNNIDYFLNNKECAIGTSYLLKRSISAIYNMNFNNELELFAGIYSFVRGYSDIYRLYWDKMLEKSVSDTNEYVDEGIKFLKEKLEYFGYDNSYKVNNKYFEDKYDVVKGHKDIFKFFMYTTLKLIDCYLKVDYFKEPFFPYDKLNDLYNSYYEDLKSCKSVS